MDQSPPTAGPVASTSATGPAAAPIAENGRRAGQRVSSLAELASVAGVTKAAGGFRHESPSTIGIRHGAGVPSLGWVVDLFCKGGGASVGYWLAGWDVVGVDIEPQQHYPFPFLQADVTALDVAALVDRLSSPSPRDETRELGDDCRLVLGDGTRPARAPFVIVHASPPCQRYSRVTPAGNRHAHPDLVPVVRDLLEALASPWVMENVPGAPLRNPVQLCGGAFGLGVRRHRLFESNLPLWSTPCVHGRPVVSVVGGYGGPARGRYVTADEGREAMGARWLPWPALTQSIPPAYTRFLGEQLAQVLGVSSPPSGFRHESQLLPRCRCGAELVASVTGRWPKHCRQACRQAAYRERIAIAHIDG